MQPYQKASEAKVQGEEAPINLLKNVGLSIGAGAGAKLGSMALSKLAPAVGALISPYVPENLSIAGLKKIDPRFGQLINDALDAGYTYDNFRDFMGEKVEDAQSQEPAKQGKNIIEQISPELHQFISEQIQKGRNAFQAGTIASKDKRFADIISKLTKEHKVSWADIIDQIYGQTAPRKKQGLMEQEAERFNAQYGNQIQQPQQANQQKWTDPLWKALVAGDQGEVAKLAGVNPQAALKLINNFNQRQGADQQQPGQGQQALMSILQQINQRLGQ